METQKLAPDGTIAPVLGPPMTLEDKVKGLNALLSETKTFRACVAHAFEILPEYGFPLEVSVKSDSRIARLTLIARRKLEDGEPLDGKDFWYSITSKY